MAPIYPSLLLLSLLTHALASPTTGTGTLKAQSFNSNFDTRTANAALPELNAAGIDNSLLYGSFSVVGASDIPLKIGIQPHSPPQTIANGIPERTTNGTAFISSVYTGSQVEKFDLKGFWFGCTPDTVTGEVALFDGCVVAVTGYKPGSTTPMEPKKFTFAPKLVKGLAPEMVFADTSALFKGVSKVTLVPTFGTTTAKTQSVVVDNVQGTLYRRV